MATGEALLALLSSGPRHGYDIKRAHDDWFAGLRPLAYGQVYSTLSRLQRDGLVEVAHTETGEGPERVVYQVTSLGRARLADWLSEPVTPAGGHSEEMIRKTLSAYRLGAEPHRLLARQREVHLRRLRSLEPAAGTPATSAGTAPALTLEHARLHLDADLRWLEVAAGLIRRGPAPPREQERSPAPPERRPPARAAGATGDGTAHDDDPTHQEAGL